MADQPASPDNELTPHENPQNLPQPANQGGGNPNETLKVEAPGIDDQPETTRLEKRKKLTLRTDTSEELSPADTVAVPAPGDTDSGSALVDPTRKRNTNTASLKRLRPQNDFSPDADPDNTETVNIKVIKEQKKQFRNMMTSSQTLRVKPEDAAQAPDLAQPQASAENPDQAKRTLKIKAPAADTRTESISRPPMPSPSAQTQVDTPAPAPQAQHSPKSTLKIKAPPGVAPAQAGGTKPGATLKIKAPAPAAGQTQAAPPPAAAQTVRQSAPAKAGKTMKLRQGRPSGQAAAKSTAAAMAAEEEDYEEVDTSQEARWGYLIPSAATIAVAAVLIFKIYQSSSELYGSLF